MFPSRSVLVPFPFTAYVILSCLIGWSLIFGQYFGVLENAGQLPLGPIVAAFLVTAGLGRRGLGEWWRHLRNLGAGLAWYLIAFLAPIAILLVAVLINAAFGAPLPTASQLAEWPTLGGAGLSMLIFVGVGEEAGWTAFAAPWLLERMRFRSAWLALAAVRTGWHLPLMIQGHLDLFHGIVGNFAFQFVVLSMFRRNGVWLLAAIWHATLNTFASQFLYRMVEGPDRERLGLLMVSGYVLLAVCLVVADRRRSDEAGLHPRPAT